MLRAVPSLAPVAAWLRGSWTVLLVGTVVTTVACVGVHRHQGLYGSQVSVYFLAPTNATEKNEITFTTDSVIATAGLVAHLVLPGAHTPPTASETTLLDEGVTEGERIRIPNAGGQWSVNFDQPVLDVQVVSRDPRRVLSRISELVRDIETTLARLQDRDRVDPRHRITSTHTPARPTVTFNGGDPRRALAMTVLIVGSLTVTAAGLFSRRRRTQLRVVSVTAVQERTARA
jgi:hypothetical protein